MLETILPNGFLCAVALIFAAFAPKKDKRDALICASLIFCDWLLYVMSWSPFSLHAGLAAIGIEIASWDIWPIVDALVAAMIIAVGYRSPYAILIWVCLIGQIFCYSVSSLNYSQFGAYSHYLDVLFWGQIACFILWGSGGVRDSLASRLDRLRNVLHQARPARTQTWRRRRR